jgi:hypothetical protein
MMKILLIALFIISGISVINYYHFSSKLNIDEISLKEKDNFKITNQDLEFKLNRLKNVNYNVVLKFMTNNNADAVALNKITYSIGKFNVVVQLIDGRGNILKLVVINDGSKLSSGRSKEYVEWYLANFSGADARDKTLKISFQSDESLFDRLDKKISLVQVYDYASFPWWVLFQRVSLITLSISLALSAVISVILLKRKH